MAASNNPTDELTDDDEYLEIPSCVESLTNSAGQLRQLALQASRYYCKLFTSHGHACQLAPKTSPLDQHDFGRRTADAAPRGTRKDQRVKHGHVGAANADSLDGLSKDRGALKELDHILRLLPLLNETVLFIERCLAAIESTIRRVTYYLSKPDQQAQQNTIKMDSFQLTKEVRLDAVFVALMDLMFALNSLDKVLTNHPSLRQDLDLFLATCKMAEHSGGELGLPSRNEMSRLVEFTSNIHVTLYANCEGNATSLFVQSVRHVQHLNLMLTKDKTSLGFKRLEQFLDEFMVFYAEHLAADAAASVDMSKIRSSTAMAIVLIGMNLVPTVHMDNLASRVFGLSCLLILHESLFKRTDRKVARAFQQAIQRTKPSNIIQLAGPNCHLLLDQFLRAHAPKSAIEGKILEQLASEQERLLTLDLVGEFERLLMKATSWLINLESEALDFALGKLENWPKRQLVVIDRGLRLAGQIRAIISAKDRSHRHHKRPLAKDDLVGLFRLVALLKAIDSAYEQHELFVSTCLLKTEHLVRVKWRQVMVKMQRRQISSKYSERKLNLDSLLLLTSLSSRPEIVKSSRGRDTQAVCLPMLLSSLSQEELQDINFCLDLLRLDFHERLVNSTTCDTLFWHASTVGLYYNYAFEEFPGAINEIHYFHRALDDLASLFAVSHRPAWSSVNIDWIIKRTDEYLRKVADELLDQFKSDFVGRVCQEFEVELRLQTHRDLYNEEHNNPFRRQLYNFKQLVKQDRRPSARFRLFDETIDLNSEIESHLNKVCYNLTSIAPHDWFAYDSMMNLARHKFNLTFVNAQLPAQTLDSGLDLLDITRNLALFASRYSYDLANQLFIEKCSNRSSNASSFGVGSMLSSYAASSSSSQSLNVLQSRHVAHSIQTHGYGVLDSTINCTYQTLKRLVNLFSRQISDDKLRASLQKEHQQFVSESRTQTRPKMPFERANRMAKQFRLTAANLSESNTGQRHMGMDLDSIRQTVTQLGNLLAFIRLIKSGALNCVSKSVDYLPELEDLSSLRLNRCAEDEFAHLSLHEQLVEASKNLDQCLSDFQENFSPKTNYLKIIVSLFTRLLSDNRQNSARCKVQSDEREGERPATPDGEAKSTSTSDEHDKRDHLKLFFLLVPSLAINYIDYLINCKERVTSRSSSARFGALISDDGFSLGVAFLLTVLNQTNEHNKLDWLGQTCAKLRADIDEIVKRSGDSKYEESLRQTSSMTIRRLNCLLAEYVGLANTLNCALLLFPMATD